MIAVVRASFLPQRLVILLQFISAYANVVGPVIADAASPRLKADLLGALGLKAQVYPLRRYGGL